MQSIGRGCASALRRSRMPAGGGSRRTASTQHGSHAESANEHFGTGFYILVASIPAMFAVYHLAQPSRDGKPPYLSTLIDKWTDQAETWSRRNDLHTRALTQVAQDRILFQTAKKNSAVELRFPEVFNTGSPYNHVAGQSRANIDSLIQHYEEQNRIEEERKLRKLERRQVRE